MSWQVSGPGGHATFEALGVSAATRTLRNQASDELSLFLDVPFDRPLRVPFQLWQTYSVLYRGRSIFAGRVLRPPTVKASGRQESVEVNLVGPWSFLERSTYVQDFEFSERQEGGDPESDDPPPRLFFSQTLSQVVLGQSKTGEKVSLVEVIREIMKTVTGVRLGDVEPSIEIPWDEARDISCAEALVRVLRWVPDAVTYFDYRQATPVMHVRLAKSLPRRTVERKFCESIHMTAREDLVPKGVIVKFVWQGDDGDRKVEEERAGTGEEGDEGVIVETIELQSSSAAIGGGPSQPAKQKVEVEPISLFSVAWWQGRLDWLRDGTFQNVEITDVVPASPPLPRELISGSIPDWMEQQDIESKRATIRARVNYEVINENGTVVSKRGGVPISTRVLCTNARSRTYYGTSNASLPGSERTFMEPAPKGLADKLFASLSRLQYEGAVVVTLEEPTLDVTPGSLLNISGGAVTWARMDATVQEVTDDVLTGRTSISVGPAKHLTANDWASLSRGARLRRTPSQGVRRPSPYGGGADGSEAEDEGSFGPQSADDTGGAEGGYWQRLRLPSDDGERYILLDGETGLIEVVTEGEEATVRISIDSGAGKVKLTEEGANQKMIVLDVKEKLATIQGDPESGEEISLRVADLEQDTGAQFHKLTIHRPGEEEPEEYDILSSAEIDLEVGGLPCCIHWAEEAESQSGVLTMGASPAECTIDSLVLVAAQMVIKDADAPTKLLITTNAGVEGETGNINVYGSGSQSFLTDSIIKIVALDLSSIVSLSRDGNGNGRIAMRLGEDAHLRLDASDNTAGATDIKLRSVYGAEDGVLKLYVYPLSEPLDAP
jgi:hypothetical protein